jgi:hypothetical protein
MNLNNAMFLETFFKAFQKLFKYFNEFELIIESDSALSKVVERFQ